GRVLPAHNAWLPPRERNSSWRRSRQGQQHRPVAGGQAASWGGAGTRQRHQTEPRPPATPANAGLLAALVPLGRLAVPPRRRGLRPRVLPSPGEGLPPVDGIAAVCRAALGGGYGRVGYTPSGKGLVEDGGAGGLKPSATLRASVADPAAFVSVCGQSPCCSAHRRGTPRRPTLPGEASVQSGCRMTTESGTTRPPTTHMSRMSSANTRTPSNHR